MLTNCSKKIFSPFDRSFRMKGHYVNSGYDSLKFGYIIGQCGNGQVKLCANFDSRVTKRWLN